MLPMTLVSALSVSTSVAPGLILHLDQKKTLCHITALHNTLMIAAPMCVDRVVSNCKNI